MGTLRQDFGYALRLIRLNPGFAGAAILSLALGVAANTSTFTLVDQILLRLLPVEKPRELVQFRMEGGRFGSQNGDGLHTFSYPLYVAFRDRNAVFSGLTGQYPERLSLAADDWGQMVDTARVAGTGAAYLCGRYVQTQLFGVNPADAPVFGVSIAALLTAALAASLMPAWRASRISPVRALRYE